MESLQRRYVQIPAKTVDVDVEERILRGVRFATRGIAQDGGIIMPGGLRLDVFQETPEVLARHAHAKEDMRPPNIGVAIALEQSDDAVDAAVQFADTTLGRDYAYIYGVNAERRAYARGWSYGVNIVERETWGLAKAREWLGRDYDQDLVPDTALKSRSVWVVTRGVLTEISATPKRADLGALTQAYREHGIRAAGEIASELQLSEALELVEDLKRERDMDRKRLDRCERELAALRGEAPSPAALGDGEGVLRELAALRDLLNGQHES